MTWREPAGDVSDWMISVATALPHPRREPPPYTLSEGVSEIGAYADSVHPQDWPKTYAVRANRESLHRELDVQRSFLGTRMGARVDDLFTAVRQETDREVTVRAAAAFDKVWISDAAKLDAFNDLCDAAKEPGATTGRLRQLARVIASQLGAEATSYSSPLRDAADALAASDEELSRWQHISIQRPLDEAERLRLARESLTAVGVGRVVVWVAYTRARVWDMRTAIGPVTLLRPEVALVHAFEDGIQDFPERAELREIRERVHWLDDLHKHSLNADSHYALARVDLGERPTAGAAEEARRLIDALLGIPVTQGGVSWDDTGAVAVIHNGRVRMLSNGLINSRTGFDDTFGIGATAEILHETSEQLGSALSKGPMPDYLLEALSALREAGMTDHRDVHFYGARPVTPRFATALEDHAIELIASVMGVASKDLASTLEHRYALGLATSQALNQLMAPFDKNWAMEDHAHRRELEDSVSHLERGGQLIVDIAKVVASQEAIRSLRMTALQRADFEDALRVCTDTSHEQRLLAWAEKESELLALVRVSMTVIRPAEPAEQASGDSGRLQDSVVIPVMYAAARGGATQGWLRRGVWDAGGVLIGLVRPLESLSVPVEGDSLAEVRERIDERTPEGFELTAMSVRMTHGTITLTSTAMLDKRDGLQEVHGDDMAAVRGMVPDGWQLLSVRRA